MDQKLLKMRCKDSKQHQVMFHELYSVNLRLCIAQNVRFEIPYKVLYFETPFLIIFKCYAWVSCGVFCCRLQKTRNHQSVVKTCHKIFSLFHSEKINVNFSR